MNVQWAQSFEHIWMCENKTCILNRYGVPGGIHTQLEHGGTIPTPMLRARGGLEVASTHARAWGAWGLPVMVVPVGEVLVVHPMREGEPTWWARLGLGSPAPMHVHGGLGGYRSWWCLRGRSWWCTHCEKENPRGGHEGWGGAQEGCGPQGRHIHTGHACPRAAHAYGGRLGRWPHMRMCATGRGPEATHGWRVLVMARAPVPG